MKRKTIIGRASEQQTLKLAFSLRRNVLIEGPVGVGKTYLVQNALESLGKKFFRVDGDTRYTEQKLTGWFDPPIVLKKGYVASAFQPGPLVQAMKAGQVLFINELNRMPEAVQNILLPAMDERRIELPRLGTVEAKEGFFVVATQNPKEFTATHALSEALLDRFEMIRLDYQSHQEEFEILTHQTKGVKKEVVERVVDLIRATRLHSAIKRGASIRAGLAVCELVASGMTLEAAVLMAVPSRVELVSSDDSVDSILLKLLESNELPLTPEKKKQRN